MELIKGTENQSKSVRCSISLESLISKYYNKKED